MRKLLLMVCALFGFMACTQNPIEEQSAIRTDAPETIRVGFEDDETRIQLNEAQKTVWTKGDQVSVFYRSNANQQWKYDGETGTRTAELKRVDTGTSTRDMDRVVVVYPYNEDYYINPSTFNVQASLPATQHYLANSYGLDGNIMISSAEYNDVTLKNVCGWLKLQLTGDGEVVKSIKFRGNDGEQVAGELYINSADATAILASDMGNVTEDDGDNATGGAGANLSFDDVVLTEVTLDCGEGVTLGAEATSFYIALPPQTFANGFTVEIECDGYELMTLTTEKELVIERNHIQPMASVEHNAEQIIPNNEIWYTNGSTTEATTPYKTNVFGANIVSNTYDVEKECWVIKFDGKVTTIGDGAFAWCSSLTSVTIPNSVTTIGSSAFYECSNLTSVTIPNSVTTIGSSAFYECSNLTSVTIPDSVTTIGNYAFKNCDSIQEFNGKFASEDGRCLIIDGVLNYFAIGCSATEYTIPDSVTTIGNEAFDDCSSLTSVTIPDSVTTIGEWAFEDCSSLTSVTIPDSVTTIGYAAFAECSSLTSVTIPNSVTKIGSYAFGYCSSLTSVTIPDSITTIGEGAFRGCSSLQEFNGKFASDDGRCLIIDGTLNDFAPAGLTEYTIPDSVTTIVNSAFQDCDSLTSVTIPDGVTTIGEGAFQVCDSLTSVTIGDSVITIGRYAFHSCESLTSVTIGDSVTTIGWNAFGYCSSLTSVYCKATTPPAGDYSMFSGNVSDRNIYVPMESVEAYKSASYWSEYASDIVGYDFENGVVVTPKPVNNKIWYTNGSTTEATTPYETNVFGANIISNTYDAEKECWVIKFDGEVTSIGYQAFYKCSSLTSVTIPDSVTTIGKGAFRGCSSLQEFNGKFASEDGRCLIIDGVLNSFAIGCGATEYTIPDSVTTIGEYAFAECYSLTSVTIPNSVTTIGSSAFEDCSSLTSVTIPDSVTTIGAHAFEGCSSLTSVTIPDSVTTIGYRAFYSCNSLTSVTIPDSVITIGRFAFSGCSSLTSVYCKAITPPAALIHSDYDWYAFYNNAPDRKIYVPMESVEAYKSAEGWSEYADAIEGYNF